jgi:hypothetical protein
MTTITTSPEQMAALSTAAYKEFENRMIAHLQEFFPDECLELGEEEVRDEIKYGVRRARVHGFESEQDVCRYIDLMFTFGGDFDADPDFEGLRLILDEEPSEDDTERMDRLYSAAMAILDA